MLTYLWIALGGALGSCLRYLLGSTVQRAVGPGFPWGTTTVNVLGCVAFGLLAGLAEHRGALAGTGRVFLLVGVLGGFTTFSTFGFETFQLLRTGQLVAATLNVAGQVGLGIAGLWIGFLLTRA